MSHSEQIDIQQQLEKLLAASPAVIYTCGPGPAFPITFISGNVRGALGYRPEDFYADPGFWNRHIHPEDREQVLTKLVGLNAERPLVLEYRFQHRDGYFLYLRDEIMLRCSEGGNVSGLTGTWIDITERKRFETELARKERKYSSLFHDSNDAIFIHDLDGNIIDVNRKALKLFGYSREEVLGMTVLDLAPEDIRANCEANLARVRLGGPVNVEKVFQRKNGECFPADLSASPVKIGDEVVVQGIVRDITERKQSEEKLRRSEAKNRAMISAIPDLMFQLNADGVFLDFHGKREQLLLPPEKFIGRPVEETLPPEVAELSRWGVSEAIATGEVQAYEYELTVGGEVKSFECRVVPSDPGEALAIIRDISPRVRMEKVQTALFRISEAANASADLPDLLGTIRGILGTLIDTTNFFVALYDEKSRLYSFPYFVDEYDGCEFAPDELKDSLTEYVRRTQRPLLANAAKHEELEARGEAKLVGSPSELWLGVPLKALDKVIGVVAVQSYHDATLYDQADIELMNFVSGHIAMAILRKQAELVLRHSEERYRSVFQAMRDGLIITDQQGQTTFVNPAACDIVGRSREKMLGQPLSNVFQNDCCASCAAEVRRKSPTNACRCELEIERPDRSKRQLSVSASPYLTSEGEQAGMVAIIVDVSDEKRLEQERQELRDKLATAQRMESLGVLAGGVAHDLNNILGPLVGYPQLIQEYLPPDSPIREQVITIEKSAKRAADVVQDLLTLARRGRYEMEPLQINKVLRQNLEAAEFKNALTQRPQIELQTELGVELPYIHGSTPHLSKVVTNLVFNAIDAMPEGGTLAIRSRCNYLEQLVSGFDQINPGRYVIISVSDTGTGIPPENIKRIFEPFYSTKQMGRSGSGLGLAVVYGVVKDHNGYVDVISEVGRGAEFLIYLPIADAFQPAAEPVETAGIWGEGHLLVVDDIEEQRQLAATLLRSVGYSVKTAATRRETLDYIREHDVDLVILDMILDSEIDGLDIYREIQSLKPDQKAIIVSGHAETVRVRQAMKLGVARFLRKPFTLQQLGLAIKEVLSGSTSRKREPAR